MTAQHLKIEKHQR